MTIAAAEEVAETTIYDVLRKIVDSTVGGDLHRDLIAAVNKLDPDAPDPVEPEPVQLTADQQEIANLKAQLAAAEAAAKVETPPPNEPAPVEVTPEAPTF
jgi:hypothetical protein